MGEHDDPVTRLGPATGGQGPAIGNPRLYTWEWGPDDRRRPGLPWIGIFLLVFALGAALLLRDAGRGMRYQ